MLLSHALDRSEVPVQFGTREAGAYAPGPVVGFRSFQPAPAEYFRRQAEVLGSDRDHVGFS